MRDPSKRLVWRWIVGASLVAGCTRPTAGEDTSPPPDLESDSGEASDTDCEGTPPVVDDLWCVNSGLKPHYETGEDTVTMQVWTAVSDSDGDLTRYTLQIFYDDVIDASVDTSTTQFNPVSGSADRPDCQATSAELGLTLYLTGSDPDYDTLYDWGVLVTDAYGLDSELFVSTCWTPTEDGDDGGDDGGADTGE